MRDPRKHAGFEQTFQRDDSMADPEPALPEEAEEESQADANDWSDPRVGQESVEPAEQEQRREDA